MSPIFFALRSRFFGSSPTSTTDQNIRFLYWEILFAAVLGGITTFNSAFAIRLGASKDLIAWLSAAPALIAAIGSIPSARFLATRRKRKVWLFGSLFLIRAGYGVVALIPLLFHTNTALWLVLWIVTLNLPAIFFTNGWNALLGELVPERRRAFVFSRRNIINSIAVVIVSALAGHWLDSLPFPANYQYMYAFGFLTVLGSQYYLHRLTFPDQAVQPARQAVDSPPIEPMKMTGPMARMLVNTAVYQFGLGLIAPLPNIYYIENLHATDGWLGLNNAAANAGVVVGYIIWERLLRRRSFGWAQKRATLFTWIFPVTVAITPDLSLIMLSNFLVNVMHSGADLSTFNVLLKLTRPEHRTTFMSWYNAVANGSVFVAPLVGAWLAGYIGIPAVFLLSGILRLAGGVMFNINRVDEPVEEPVAVT
jgi:predicted MFS family arabinose efflux permease